MTARIPEISLDDTAATASNEQPDAAATMTTTTDSQSTSNAPARLPFPSLTTSHILSCSVHAWYPLFRPHTPKARLITLPPAFTSYLRADGIVVPPSRPSTPRQRPPHNPNHRAEVEEDEGFFSSSALSSPADSDASSSDDEDADPSQAWPEVHARITSTIAELGGAVVPKLNWSAPKDATWISATNSMECRSANDIYLLLKSSDFVTFDLGHVFEGCVDWDASVGVIPTQSTNPRSSAQSSSEQSTAPSTRTPAFLLDATIPYTLMLRKHFQLNPSLEFRIFVRDNQVLGMTQRDLNHYDFLFKLRSKLKRLILDFWTKNVKGVFPEHSYTMDVYIPPPHERVWIIDFNPWDLRTDPGLWSWGELLGMSVPVDVPEDVVRLPIRVASDTDSPRELSTDGHDDTLTAHNDHDHHDEDDSDATSIGSDDELVSSEQTDAFPELRLVQRDDPEAYMFNSTRYSAHKLPRDVVDASQAGEGGLREFAAQWREVLERRQREDAEDGESSADDDAAL